MRINFYDTRLEGSQTVLVKEKSMNYTTDKTFSPVEVVKLLNDLTSLNVMGEEHCYMLALNGKEQLIGIFFISKGTVNQTFLNPREIFIRALLIGASFIILCHNHPSGSISLSKNDQIATQVIQVAGEFIGIPMIDHIIIGGDDYFSFMAKGLLSKEAEP